MDRNQSIFSEKRNEIIGRYNDTNDWILGYKNDLNRDTKNHEYK